GAPGGGSGRSPQATSAAQAAASTAAGPGRAGVIGCGDTRTTVSERAGERIDERGRQAERRDTDQRAAEPEPRAQLAAHRTAAGVRELMEAPFGAQHLEGL